MIFIFTANAFIYFSVCPPRMMKREQSTTEIKTPKRFRKVDDYTLVLVDDIADSLASVNICYFILFIFLRYSFIV